MRQLKFPRPQSDLLISTTESGLYIVYGWTVTIPKADALHYVEKYNAGEQLEADAGFLVDEDGTIFNDGAGRIALSHRDAKITLSEEEARQIIQLILEFY